MSCSALKQLYPETKSGKYQINPKAAYNTAVEVNCDMNDKNGVGVTEIKHDSELSFKVLLQFIVSNNLMCCALVLKCFLYYALYGTTQLRQVLNLLIYMIYSKNQWTVFNTFRGENDVFTDI